MNDKLIAKLQEMIDKAKRIVIMTGAGFSTASGIPDFRGADGLYTDGKTMVPPEVIISHHYFMEHPQEFYQYYYDKMIYPKALPNQGHYFVAKLEQNQKLMAVITQNIDGLHQIAGSKTVYELHGTIMRNHCMKCHSGYSLEDILTLGKVPYCPKCGGLIKPDVTLYEEPLEEDILDKALRAIVNCDLLIIAGSSMVVNPAASLPYHYRGVHMVIINLGTTPLDRYASLVIRERTEEVFDRIKL